MASTQVHRRTISIQDQDDYLQVWIEAFLIDRKAQNAAPGTLKFYSQKLEVFARFCDGQEIKRIHQITPTTIREYLLWLEAGKHNPGGIHAHFRALKAFLRWFEMEYEPEDWKNPIRKVKAPKVDIEPLEPVDLATIHALLGTCEAGTFTGDRDKAIILALYDTGARAAEFCAINLDDCNLLKGEILIRKGKGGKPRAVYLGKESRRALHAYLKRRGDSDPGLWVIEAGTRLTQNGMDDMLERRSAVANVKGANPHAFRRAFALNMLRASVDIFTLAKLMGHGDIQVLRRYLAQTNQDTREAHLRAGPVDHILKKRK